ncbi:monooxygenase [Pseudomonas oryzihabitans]|nr:monooxygenase [Pseudomonas psychrotolerans]KTT22305.1 monooxygenase [Pseudomonas psychrotolerans]
MAALDNRSLHCTTSDPFILVAATPQQSRLHRLLGLLAVPWQLPRRWCNTQALRDRSQPYHYIGQRIRCADGSKRRYLRLPTFAGEYHVLVGVEEIRGLMQHPRMGQGELVSDGRQFLVIADALGRMRLSKERQDAKQKRNIIAHLVSGPERFIQTMRRLSEQRVRRWWQGAPTLLVNQELSEFTAEVYLRSVMNLQGPVEGVGQMLEEQVDLLGQAFAYRKPAHFNRRFNELKRQLVARIGNDPGLLKSTDYTHRLNAYIDQHYQSQQDEAFATGLNGAVLAGYIAPYPSFLALVDELGRHPHYRQALRQELQEQGDNHNVYIRRDDTLLHACVHEVLRLHPAQPFLFRAASRDLMLNGHFVRQGSELVADIYHVLRLPELWGDDADRFRPERFQDIPERYRQPFLAYSSGPNNCTGQMFSRYSLKVLLAELVRFGDWEATDEPLEHHFHFALAMNRPVRIRLKEHQHG